jgi:hypothetical protein
MRQVQSLLFSTLGTLFVFAAFSHPAYAATGITAEGVSDYSYARALYGSGYAPDIDMATEASGFYNTMTTTTGTPWTASYFWTNSLVFDTDFYDPDVSGNSFSAYDDDTYNFDSSGAAIAFVGGHGTCDDALGTNCTTSANCNVGDACMANPPSSNSSRCATPSPRRLVVSEQYPTHGDWIFYGNGFVKWGEDTNSGSWAGAGTNGGSAVVFVVNSCGTRYPFTWGEAKPAYAGAMLINWTMPQSNVATAGSADTWTWSSRGSTLATYALANPNSSVAGAWFANLNSAPSTAGYSCPDETSTYTYGGGYGYTGCGGNLSMSWAQTQAAATANVTSLTWTQAQNFANKPTGNTYGYEWVQCNYDCATYGLSK